MATVLLHDVTGGTARVCVDATWSDRDAADYAKNELGGDWRCDAVVPPEPCTLMRNHVHRELRRSA